MSWRTDAGCNSVTSVHSAPSTTLKSVMPGKCLKWPLLTTHIGCKLGIVLALLGVVLSTCSCPQFLWWWRDKKKTWVTFRHLFMVVHVSPLSLSHWGASVVRVGCLMLWPGWLVPEPASRAVVVPGWAVTSASSSRVAPLVSSSVCGADTWHVGSLRQHLQARGRWLMYESSLSHRKQVQYIARSAQTRKMKTKCNLLKEQYVALCLKWYCRQNSNYWTTHFCSLPLGLFLWTRSHANQWHSAQSLDQRTLYKQNCKRGRERAVQQIPLNDNKQAAKSKNCKHKLNLPLWMAREPVTQDGDSVDRTTAVKMDLQLICSSTIVYLECVQQCVRSVVWKTCSWWRKDK